MKRIGSICAGIGGFDLAFHSAGYETVWYSEIEPQCCKLLAEKFPNAKSYGDLTQFKPDPKTDRVNVVCGGTPCQDISVAGKRAGLDGKRSGLFYQMVRVCKRLRPRHIVWENVPGAFSSCRGNDFAHVLRAFTGLKVEVPTEGWGNAGFLRTPFPACRWNVAWRVLDAQYFGLAQRRERVFLVGSLGDASCLEILFEPESVRGDSAPSREAGQRVAPTVEARANGGGGSWGTDFLAGGGVLAEYQSPSPIQPPSRQRDLHPGSRPANRRSVKRGGANGPGRTADDAEGLICERTSLGQMEQGDGGAKW